MDTPNPLLADKHTLNEHSMIASTQASSPVFINFFFMCNHLMRGDKPNKLSLFFIVGVSIPQTL